MVSDAKIEIWYLILSIYHKIFDLGMAICMKIDQFFDKMWKAVPYFLIEPQITQVCTSANIKEAIQTRFLAWIPDIIVNNDSTSAKQNNLGFTVFPMRDANYGIQETTWKNHRKVPTVVLSDLLLVMS